MVSGCRRCCCVALIFICFPASYLAAQFPTTLQRKSVEQFDAYAAEIEQRLDVRWHHQPFLVIDESAELRNRVMKRQIDVRPGVPENPIDISSGLVHDWIGDVFIPGTTVQKVLSILQDFDRHASIYPEVTKSHLVSRTGNHIKGYWRLEKKGQVIPVVLDVEDDADYQQLAADKWTCRAYAKNISEVENAGTPQEQKLPVGQGNGFLWRLYAYWSLEAVNGGVLAECRTLSLSRAIPPGLGWVIKPLIKNLPRESLTSTLENTRKAVENSP
jgi:hypothetical protein